MQWYYGFDFGSDSVRTVDASGKIGSEAAWAATRGDEANPFAWGDRAYAFLGRENKNVRLERCMRGGVPENPELMRKWVLRALSGADRSVLRRRRALIAVSREVAPGVREHMINTVLSEGMDMVGVVCMDMLHALGCELDVMGDRGVFSLDMGASRMTFSVIAGGRCLRTRTLPYGMDRADENIMDRVREAEGVIVSRRVARLLKHSAFSGMGREVKLPVFDPYTRLPKFMQLDPEIAQSSLNEIVSGVLELCKSAIGGLSPELNEDLEAGGIVLSGGGSLLGGLDVCLSEELKLPVSVAEDPVNAAARGLKLILKQPELFSPLIVDWREGALRL